MKIYIVITDENDHDEIDKVFLNFKDADTYTENNEYKWIEEHDVIE